MPRKNEKNKSRMGKHPDWYVMFGGMVPPKKKAIAMITAAVVAGSGKLSVLDLIWKGIENIAKAYGVLDNNGNITEKYRDAILLAEYTISENQKKRRQKNA
jgi:hypothetical protein